MLIEPGARGRQAPSHGGPGARCVTRSRQGQGPGGRHVNEVELSRATRLLPLAVIAAAVVPVRVGADDRLRVHPARRREPLCAQGGADRHGNALIVLAVFAIGALAIAVFTGSKPAAIAVAACGGVALLIFLIGDLRVANARLAQRGVRPARRLVHRRAGGPAGRLLARDGRLARADGHRDRPGDHDAGPAAGPAPAPARPADRRARSGHHRVGARRPLRRTPKLSERREGTARAPHPAAANAPARLMPPAARSYQR